MSNVLMLLQFTLYRLYNENVFSHVRNWMIAYVSSYAAKFLLIVWLQKKLLPLGRYFSRLDILYICTDSFSLNSINMQMSTVCNLGYALEFAKLCMVFVFVSIFDNIYYSHGIVKAIDNIWKVENVMPVRQKLQYLYSTFYVMMKIQITMDLICFCIRTKKMTSVLYQMCTCNPLHEWA